MFAVYTSNTNHSVLLRPTCMGGKGSEKLQHILSLHSFIQHSEYLLRSRPSCAAGDTAVGGSPQAEDRPLTGTGGALSQMDVTDRIPELFTARNRREETKQAGTDGGGRELTEGVMAAAL